MSKDINTIKDKYGSSFNKLKEIWALFILFLSVFFFLSFLTYNDGDLYLYTSSGNLKSPHNFFGIAGAYCAYYPLTFQGIAAYICPIFFFFWGIRSMISGFRIGFIRCSVKIILFILINLSACIFVQLTSPFIPANILNLSPTRYPGGIIGKYITEKFAFVYMGMKGSIVIAAFVLIAGSLLIADGRPLIIFRWIGYKFFYIFVILYNSLITIFTFIKEEIHRDNDIEQPKFSKKQKKSFQEPEPDPEIEPELDFSLNKPQTEQSYAKPQIETSIHKHESEPQEKYIRTQKSHAEFPYKFPPVDLLDTPKQPNDSQITESLKRKAELLQKTLFDFGIDVNISDIVRGPVITRYELTLSPGTKVQRITALEDDIGLAMKTPNIRIVAPIPGKSAIGIEVPNDIKNLVALRDLLYSKEYDNLKTDLPLILGKDISGAPIITDLTSAPHLLIAGATGSGKSVCLNSIIISLLYSCAPHNLRFLMVDPKKVELAQYNDIPHMLCPVITDAKKASGGLNWVVREMDERYQILADAGVRNIKSFNSLPEEKRIAVSIEKNFYKGIMPYIVVILDELADLMIVAQDEIEDAITRLAQLSRAVGIHLILATQRPSVNVITGVIKANFPVRISFKVSSKVDSRTVLDANGAEILLGNGDFLFLPPGSSKLIRGQGTYLSDKEIQRIIEFVKGQTPEEDQANDIFEEELFTNQNEEIDDELYDQAIEIVKLTKQASSSVLQRKLRIGYARAARLIDIMEANGIVGPHRGSKPREILIED